MTLARGRCWGRNCWELGLRIALQLQLVQGLSLSPRSLGKAHRREREGGERLLPRKQKASTPQVCIWNGWSLYTGTSTHMCITYTHGHTCTHIDAHMFTCASAHTCACTCIHTYMPTIHTHTAHRSQLGDAATFLDISYQSSYTPIALS
jgi:hypothetical protein